MIVKILTTYPEISTDWLVMGEGNMLKTNRNESDNTTLNTGLQSEDKDTQKIGDKQMFIPENTAISHDPAVGTPYYDVDFLGGFSEIFNSQTSVPTTNIVIRGFEKADLWCNVTGHSMEPKINHGDIIALRHCTLDDIQYGEIYAVVLDTIRTIKILRKSATPDSLRFIPINNDYDEQEFPKARITNVFEVIGSISKFF